MPSWSSVTQLLQRHGHFLPVNKNARQVMNVFSGATREKARNCPDKKMYGGVATTRSENVRLSQMSEQDFNARMMTLTDSFIALRNETDRREGVTYLTPEGWTQEVPALHIKTARVGSDTRYEAMVLTDCRHENVIRCFGSSEDGSELNLEAGEHDLHARIVSQGSGRLRLNEVLEVARGVAAGLEFVHNCGYGHNDIKPENIVLFRHSDGSGKVIPKIIDFEHAERIDATGVPAMGTEMMAGTRAFFSPERFFEDDEEISGEPEFDRRASDMWSLGVVVHLAAFGVYPNGTTDPRPLLTEDYSAPVGFDPHLGTLLQNMLKADPEERWSAVQARKHIDYWGYINSASTYETTLTFAEGCFTEDPAEKVYESYFHSQGTPMTPDSVLAVEKTEFYFFPHSCSDCKLIDTETVISALAV